MVVVVLFTGARVGRGLMQHEMIQPARIGWAQRRGDDCTCRILEDAIWVPLDMVRRSEHTHTGIEYLEASEA